MDDVLAALAAGERASPALPLVEPAEALGHLERQVISDELAGDVRMGRRTALAALQPGAATGDRRLCLLDGRGKLVAVVRASNGAVIEILRVFRP
jgi:hypothetical protein